MPRHAARWSLLCAAFASGGCASAQSEPRQGDSAAPAEIQLTSTEQRSEVTPSRLLDPSEVVPPFAVTALDGQSIDSSQLVGHAPFVVFYFATWCGWCDKKMTVLGEALAPFDIEVIGVAVDDVETVALVPAYVRDHDFDHPVVLAAEHPTFARAYNPLGGVPFLLVVGRDGMLTHGQVGYDPSDGQRLAMAVASAVRAP